MDVGLQLVFSAYGWQGITDRQVYEEELRLALLAEELGFDALWPAEHHFFDYALCPDNTQILSYLAGRTERIDLGTAAVIMPWNEPLRVAEKISMLDELCGGRVRFGMGRGLSRREYEPFRGVEMDTSRERFDESAEMVVRALETGFIEGDGPYYPQPRTEIRPRPSRSFKGRLYAVAGVRRLGRFCCSPRRPHGHVRGAPVGSSAPSLRALPKGLSRVPRCGGPSADDCGLHVLRQRR